jgi:hypothetical protein
MSKVDINKYSDVKSDVLCDVSSDLYSNGNGTQEPQTLKVQIPQGISLSDVYNGYTKNQKRGSDLNAYLVSHLVSRNLYRRQKINEFVPLSSSALRNMFGGDYSKYINSLQENGIIEEYSQPYEYTMYSGKKVKCKGTYSTSFGKAKQYRLLVDPETPLEDYTIDDKLVLQKINSARVDKLQRLIESDSTIAKMYESIKRLSINTNAALDYCKRQYRVKELINFAKAFLRKNSKADLKEFYRLMLQNSKNQKKRIAIVKQFGISDQYAVTWSDAALELCKLYSRFQARVRWIRVIEQIQKGNYSYITIAKDRWSGRVYNTMTLTPQDIRPYIKLDNEPLIEFDGGNAQWKCFIKLCNILCKPLFYKDIIDKYYINTQHKNDTTHHTTIDSLNMLHTFSEYFEKYRIDIEAEAVKLDEWTGESNRLRNYIAFELQEKGRNVSEKDAKRMLISNVLFGNVNDRGYNNYESVKLFKAQFPHLFDVMLKLKKYWIDEKRWGYQPFDVYKRPLKWKAFPRLLQKMESEIFIGAMKNTRSHFITMHDAIITNQSGAAEIKKNLDKAVDKSRTKLTLKFKTYEQSI